MELLAPAGEFESLVMAVQNGADAVYVGGNMFSARKNAVNFDLLELTRAVDYCHLRGAKLYLAVNTLIKEFELSDLCRYLEDIYRIGVDAVIVQDMGVFSLVRKYLPELSVNASTQMTVNSAAGAKELERLGAKRVVLARELSANEIKEIKSQTNIELEVFVHGALCMSYSGQCLMSSMLGGRSGNRGACAQPCRLPYTLLCDGKAVTDAMPLLSPKDLCLVKRLDEVRQSGADSLKIEGRMKSPEYVGMVTKVYRAALSGEFSDKDAEEMLSLFSRGGSSFGYFDGRKFRDMMNYEEGSKISASREVEKKIHETVRTENIKMPVSMEFEAKIGEPISLKMRAGENEVCVSGDTAETAINRPTDEGRIKEQLEKLGQTPFGAEEVRVNTDGKSAVGIGAINALRRDAAEKLSEKICASYHRESKNVEPDVSASNKEKKEPVLCVFVTNEEQYDAVKKVGGCEIYLPYELYIKAEDKDAVCVLPELPKEGEKLNIPKGARVMVNNIGQFEVARGREILGGHRLNVYNSASAGALRKLGTDVITVSPELNLKEIKELSENTDASLEVIAYGRLPLMLMENCVIKSAHRCECSKKSFALRDRKGIDFPIVTENCRNILLNSCPIYMADRIDDIKSLQIDRIRLSFTVENPDLCCIIIDEYKNALAGQAVKSPRYEYTRGHFYRGVL